VNINLVVKIYYTAAL